MSARIIAAAKAALGADLKVIRILVIFVFLAMRTVLYPS